MTASAPIKVSRIYFNSHPHEEDDSIDAYIPTVIYISTHILTKRMTLPLLICLFHLFHFNSHPHEEDDGISQWKFNGINISTHILTKRMTLVSVLKVHTVYDISTHILTKRMTIIANKKEYQGYFNSHPHEEDDGGTYRHSPSGYISTHILTKRMTRLTPHTPETLIFQLTSSRRG